MDIVALKTRMLSRKILAHISEEFRRVYKIREDHESVGMFTTDNDDVAYMAIDDATKKSRIEVVHADTLYGGEGCSTWSKYGGRIFVLFSGPKVADVKDGLRYATDFVNYHSGLQSFDGEEDLSFYAQTIPRAGKFFQERYGIPEGNAYSYLMAGPIEANYAIDKALKAGNTQLVHYWQPPSNCNSSGVLITGTESACRAAQKAFVEGLRFVFMNPLSY